MITDEWLTPPEIINALGRFDLDPCAPIVRPWDMAREHYTIIDNGLWKQWHGRVWLNPPYEGTLIKKFISKLVDSINSGQVTQAIILVNNATETSWFQELSIVATCIVFPSRRVKFIDRKGKPTGSPLQGQAIVYCGKNTKNFIKAYSDYGFAVEVC